MNDFRQLTTLRGDYTQAGADYVVEQAWDRYTPAQQTLWRRLYDRQQALVQRYACAEYLQALGRLDLSQGIPRFEAINPALLQATGWQIVPVPGLVPDEVFFTHLAGRRFPATVWLREPQEFDYIVEPDAFHDIYGHVPLLFDRAYADYLEAFGKGGLRALKHEALTFLARLYWYTIEFGLIRTADGLKVYGAGILSSGGEMSYAIADAKPRRRDFDLLEVMRTGYDIDHFQDNYFVIESFAALRNDTAADFVPMYARLRACP